MAYWEMLGEHTQEIANSINQIRMLTTSLEAWDRHLASKDDDKQRLSLIVEFIDPPATVALNLPYVIRSRFIYSIAHLCHQANQTVNPKWKDDLRLDSEIKFKDADIHGRDWRSYNRLKLNLEKIEGEQYRKETQDFRNKYNHRYSPKIEIGLTELVTRVRVSGRFTYAFGYAEPLKLQNVVAILKQQHKACCVAFSSYQILIADHIKSIKEHNDKLRLV